MTFKLPELQYTYDALEPVIDAKTMEIHHSKHHAAYVNNLNAALAKYPELDFKCPTKLLKSIDTIPADIKQAVINNAGGHLNHLLFWKLLTTPDTSVYDGEIKEKIDSDLGGYDKFLELFTAAATSRFGSGWAWLVLNAQGKLEVLSTPNQDSPVLDGKSPLLGLDVWEHAYYLNYQNRRPEYIKEFFRVINWEYVNERLKKSIEMDGCDR
ncbi:superoxide dismutase [Gemella sp. 19428wG2_WT2a]|nr:superoxide dismutase [Gemella sp. 19428wG2_WT2a]TFU59987.1 superoxide dismutase [Gemella sp. WT2a]